MTQQREREREKERVKRKTMGESKKEREWTSKISEATKRNGARGERLQKCTERREKKRKDIDQKDRQRERERKREEERENRTKHWQIFSL